MNPLHSFRDHPQLKDDRPETIYLCRNGFYWATYDRLTAITINLVTRTNMGDPFRELARIEFECQPDGYKDSIDIDHKDAVALIEYCQQSGYSIDVSSEFLNSRRH